MRNKLVNDVVFNKEAHHLSFFDIPKDVERASSVVEGRDVVPCYCLSIEMHVILRTCKVYPLWMLMLFPVVVSIMRWLSFQGLLRCIQCGNLVTGFPVLWPKCPFALLLLWKDAYGSVSETNFVPTASPSKMMLSGKSLLF
ncbi:hypothetical protein Tco_1005006 [Tanacetum coccineum]|uniref:Uncharacterized protein n=1 Tax=Tanacetum coccineum TaxID=301880 RepID=A0ABQ5FEW9_9ASTR